jgi:hypothetical protein
VNQALKFHVRWTVKNSTLTCVQKWGILRYAPNDTMHAISPGKVSFQTTIVQLGEFGVSFIVGKHPPPLCSFFWLSWLGE